MEWHVTVIGTKSNVRMWTCENANDSISGIVLNMDTRIAAHSFLPLIMVMELSRTKKV